MTETANRPENKALKLVGQFFWFIFACLIIGGLLPPLILLPLGPKFIYAAYLITLPVIGFVFWRVRNVRLGLGKFLALAIVSMLVLSLGSFWVRKFMTKFPPQESSQEMPTQ